MSHTWLRNLAHTFGVRRNRKARRLTAGRTRRLQIESLENRVVPSTTGNSSAGQPANLDFLPAGPQIGIQATNPLATFHNASAVSGYGLTSGATATPTTAEVTNVVQQWALNPNSNLGFNVRQLNA